ncbi:Protein PPP5D1 [Plecturocebus cupreus]
MEAPRRRISRSAAGQIRRLLLCPSLPLSTPHSFVRVTGPRDTRILQDSGIHQKRYPNLATWKLPQRSGRALESIHSASPGRRLPTCGSPLRVGLGGQGGRSRGQEVETILASMGLTLSLRMECNGMIIDHCSLDILGSSHPPTSASQEVGTTGMHHHAWLIFY